jgi:hypothetical protein
MLFKITKSDPCYANIFNFMVAGYVPPGENKTKLIYESHVHIWDEPYLFKVCFDGLLKRCVLVEEGIKIIQMMPLVTTCRALWHIPTHSKIWQSGFFWPTMYEDTKDFVWRYEVCQRHGNINSTDAMPLTNNLQIKLFDV